MKTIEDAEQDEAAQLVRVLLMSTGRRCRLCPVIVQPVAGDLDEGMRQHKQVVHRISA